MTISDADQNLHNQALQLSQKFKRAEAELLEILSQIDEQKVYLKFGVSSLFRYSVEILGLTEAQSYSFMAVARKCKEVPLMKTEIQKGKSFGFKGRPHCLGRDPRKRTSLGAKGGEPSQDKARSGYRRRPPRSPEA